MFSSAYAPILEIIELTNLFKHLLAQELIASWNIMPFSDKSFLFEFFFFFFK